MSSAVRYLSISELLYINGRVLNDEKILKGEQQIREIERLDAAVARPAASAFGADAYPTLREKASVLFHSLVRNHPFRDGNKRTATVGLLFMLMVNGQRVTWDAPEALQIILDVAEGRTDYPEFAAWLPLTDEGIVSEQDAEQDMHRISQLIETHRWLLDELERQ